MSLRARILLSIVAVNLVVAALLGLYLLNDLEGRDRAKREAKDRRDKLFDAKFEQAFDGYLSVNVTTEEEKVAAAVRELRRHPVRSLVKDGVVLQTGTASVSASPLGVDAVLPANALYMNLPGAKHRAPTFDDRRARERIRQAIAERRYVRETDPQLRGWVAAPIRLGHPSVRDPSAPIWGGGYFLLDLPEDEEWVPTFQPRTLLLGMGAGTLVLLALTWLLLERFVLKPLADLSAGAERVARRAYDPPVPGAGSDEIGRVVSTFNSMMAQVRDAERHLTVKVEEATRRAEEHGRGLVIAQRLAATGTLASGIAHEINNPLGGMLNAALKLEQEAKQDPAGEHRLRYLRLLVSGLTRVQEIVKRVLHFTPRHVAPAVVPVLDLVRGAAAFAEHRAKLAHVAIRVSGDEAKVLAVPGEMQQVFLNLLLNACDAMASEKLDARAYEKLDAKASRASDAAAPKGGHVEVVARAVGGRIEIEVTDDGPGMSKEQQERCFDLFFTTKEAGKGTGLGLSVAHHIVEQHGGTIAVRSEPGRGATFTVSLPVARDR